MCGQVIGFECVHLVKGLGYGILVLDWVCSDLEIDALRHGFYSPLTIVGIGNMLSVTNGTHRRLVALAAKWEVPRDG